MPLHKRPSRTALVVSCSLNATSRSHRLAVRAEQVLSENSHDVKLVDLRDYQVDLPLFESADPDAIFMHCLPAHRGEEVTADVVDHPRSVIFDQAENRLHTQKALMVALMG